MKSPMRDKSNAPKHCNNCPNRIFQCMRRSDLSQCECCEHASTCTSSAVPVTTLNERTVFNIRSSNLYWYSYQTRKLCFLMYIVPGSWHEIHARIRSRISQPHSNRSENSSCCAVDPAQKSRRTGRASRVFLEHAASFPVISKSYPCDGSRGVAISRGAMLRWKGRPFL